MDRWDTMKFFFQAEDGIRDGRVTGVQTCALPISLVAAAVLAEAGPWTLYLWRFQLLLLGLAAVLAGALAILQIGRASCREECRAPWRPPTRQRRQQTSRHSTRPARN